MKVKWFSASALFKASSRYNAGSLRCGEPNFLFNNASPDRMQLHNAKSLLLQCSWKTMGRNSLAGGGRANTDSCFLIPCFLNGNWFVTWTINTVLYCLKRMQVLINRFLLDWLHVYIIIKINKYIYLLTDISDRLAEPFYDTEVTRELKIFVIENILSNKKFKQSTESCYEWRLIREDKENGRL